MAECSCKGWKTGMEQIVQAQMFLAMREQEYTGDPFKFCPWCGRELKDSEEEDKDILPME